MNNAKFYSENGFAVIRNNEIKRSIMGLKDEFVGLIKRFDDDIEKNRTLIKRFGDKPRVAGIFSCQSLLETVCSEFGLIDPVYCGPVVTHYTSNNSTGSSYGLPFHQDYPSMGSSDNSIITWFALNDCSPDNHSISVISGLHKFGVLQGEQRDNGYHLELDVKQIESAQVLTIECGDILVMSSFLPHKTFINPDYDGWKLSLSRRFDDLGNHEWQSRKYKNAYSTQVDRNLYLDYVRRRK